MARKLALNDNATPKGKVIKDIEYTDAEIAKLSDKEQQSDANIGSKPYLNTA